MVGPENKSKENFFHSILLAIHLSASIVKENLFYRFNVVSLERNFYLLFCIILGFELKLETQFCSRQKWTKGEKREDCQQKLQLVDCAINLSINIKSE